MLAAIDIRADHCQHGSVLTRHSGFNMHTVNPDINKVLVNQRALTPLVILGFELRIEAHDCSW